MDLSPELLVRRSGTLSLLSATAEEANRLTAGNECNIARVVRVIESDRGLSARLLQVVNSPLFGFPSSVTTVGRAVTILGPRDLGDLTIAAAAVNACECLWNQTDRDQRFREHALYGAVTARMLAELRHEPHQERFFLAGLLHDIGSLILHLAVPNLHAQSARLARERSMARHAAEREVIGMHHGEVGAALARGWGLSENVIAAISHHHAPWESRHPLEAAVAHVSDYIAHCALSGTAAAEEIDPRAWDYIAIPPSRLLDNRAEIDRRVSAVRRSLSPQIQAA